MAIGEAPERISWLTGEPAGGPHPALGATELATLDIGILMAIADGELADIERQRLAEIVVELSAGALDRVTARANVDRCVRLFDEGAHEDSLDAAVARLIEPRARTRAFRFASAVALADGRLDRAESRLMDRLARALRIAAHDAAIHLDDVRNALRR